MVDFEISGVTMQKSMFLMGRIRKKISTTVLGCNTFVTLCAVKYKLYYCSVLISSLLCPSYCCLNVALLLIDFSSVSSLLKTVIYSESK